MDRTPRANRNPATPSPISSSPAVQESPFSNFLRNLSPINTETAASHSQRLLGTNLPTPQVVFTSPHINLQRGNSFLERDDRVEAGSDVYKECNTTIVQNLSFEEVQLCSPSGSVDKYLADPEEADCTKSAELHSKATDQVPRFLQGGFTACKESNTKNEPLALSDKTEEALSSLEMSEAAINQRDGQTTEQFPRFTYENVKESDINVDLFSSAQNCGANAAKLQSAGCQSKEQNASGQSYEDSNESSRKALKGPVKESGQNQRGIRRHLQFEAEKAYKVTILGNRGSPCSLGRDTTNLRSPFILKNSNSLASSHFDTRASSSPQALSSDTSKFPPSPYESFRSTQIGVNSATSALIHSGIGLHLNHIARSTSTSSDIFSSKKSTGYLSTPEQMLEHDHRNNIAVNSSSSLTSAVFGEIYSHVANSQQEFQAVAEASSFAYHCTDVMKPPCDSMQLILVDQEAAPCESGMSASQDADKVEELIQLSPKRKRRKAAYLSEECKRCTCKRSKCLKLYCECFAAGVYCVSSCACENCYNKPEFEDTVLDIRHQIESRNPLAFAPKVVDNANNSLANFTEDRNLMTPSSARHKRGCNCKKSKCLKKYCECYQAKVGCSSGCRCDCCQNTFGTKADAAYNRAERWETHPAEKLDTVKGVVDCIKAASINQYSPTWAGLSDISNLTPLSHPSASSSIRNFVKIPQAQARSSQLQPSRTARFDWGCSPVIVTPQLSEGKGAHGPSSDGARHDITDDDDASEILKETYPTKVVKGSSPNQKRVSPPQSRSRLRPSSPTGLRSGRKFILQAVPSFPPLTPYSTSKEGTNEIGNDDKATNKNNWTTQKELGEA